MELEVPFCRPSITEADIHAVEAVMRGGWIAYGPETALFEQAMAAFVGVPHAVSLNSCTTALELALRFKGISGDVIIPSFTWVAVANAVINSGAVPVFADVDAATYNLTAQSIAEQITHKTEAVIVPHYGGQPAEIDAISALCEKHGLLLIEDCAETLGGSWKGRQAGATGIGCFSFYPTKALTTAMGGMLVCRDAKLVDDVRTCATHGLPTSTPLDGTAHKPWERAAIMPGRNLRLPNLLAALGLEQIKSVDFYNSCRRDIARRYDERLSGYDDALTLPVASPFAHHVYQMYSVRIRNGQRDRVLQRLWESRIQANTHFNPPIHSQPWYAHQGYAACHLPVTMSLVGEILTIPIFPRMSVLEVDHVANCLLRALCE